jgi:hypothetical protein
LDACADALARAAGFRRLIIRTAAFSLLACVKGEGPVARLYIEGDGHARRDRSTPSDDPTPWQPAALELAAVDPAATVAWLVRPHQYLLKDNDTNCVPIWWIGWRYHESVIVSGSEAPQRLRLVMRAKRLELVGFSGGGVVAALVAPRQKDIANLRTVAANQDIALWTALSTSAGWMDR